MVGPDFCAFFLVKLALSRFIDSVLCIMRNWWIDHADNNIYKCLFMLHETICAQQPSLLFQMPKLKLILENVASGKSDYPYWGKGSVESKGGHSIRMNTLYKPLKSCSSSNQSCGRNDGFISRGRNRSYI